MITRRSVLATLTSAPLWGAGRKPNIVVILADDLGFADLGFQGSKEMRTPHIDSIVRGGVRFKNGYVSHPFCSPTRAGLLTGRYQQRFGHENNMLFEYGNPNDGLPVSEITLPQLLQKAGYVTGLIGKWHLGAHEKFHPLKRGFKEMYGFQGGGHDYFDIGKKGDTRQMYLPIERHDGTVETKPGYVTTMLGREAEAFVRRHKKDPFFLYFAFNAPHSPLQAPEEMIAKYSSIADPKRRTYAAMVGAMDDAVGRVLTALKEEGLEKDTLVFFLSDNGGPKDNMSSNSPLRATKRTVYEGGVHVPFAMKWPGKVKAGETFEPPVISLDIFSTALAAAGVDAPKDRKIDGVNLVPYVEGKASGRPHPYLFWRAFGGTYLAVRDAQYKLVRIEGKPDELYDLEQDISEEKNVIASQPAAYKRLAAAMEGWNKELVKPLWLDHIQDRDKLGGKKE